MVIANSKNKGLDVTDVSKHLFGGDHTISDSVNNAGFSYGSRRVIQSDDSVNFLATVNLSLKALRTTGSNKNQSRFSIIESVSI